MHNSDIFLASFNRIEKGLRSLLIHKKDVGFSRAVKILRKSNPIVKQYSDDLLEFAELRNAIIHDRTNASYVIAEPHEKVVEKMAKIEKELTHPRRVFQVFYRNVCTFQLDAPIKKLLNAIYINDFSKFPIYRGREFKGLITQKGITNWLANQASEDNKNIMETKLEAVLEYEEPHNYKFISGNSSVFEALEMFKEQIGNGQRLEALLITKNGEPTEKLDGIITNWDIMKVKP
ncbi:CBS domain-containing protein [Oceanobacillus senegalensis]|uniref:CBS domain-containing protein n=1 Tax=Oceanobacillus senegalensis TaxID=1936063 RepID=UPI000A309013|nr:CBS domain-containing protein [Oceanobacillus senegalensis]